MYSATNSPLLAKSLQKEFGNLPEGKIYESTGNFKIIDYETDEGRKYGIHSVKLITKEPKRKEGWGLMVEKLVTLRSLK